LFIKRYKITSNHNVCWSKKCNLF